MPSSIPMMSGAGGLGNCCCYGNDWTGIGYCYYLGGYGAACFFWVLDLALIGFCCWLGPSRLNWTKICFGYFFSAFCFGFLGSLFLVLPPAAVSCMIICDFFSSILCFFIISCYFCFTNSSLSSSVSSSLCGDAAHLFSFSSVKITGKSGLCFCRLTLLLTMQLGSTTSSLSPSAWSLASYFHSK